MAHFLGIDIGTGESKGVLIDEDCSIVCTASCAHGTDNPRPTWFEHDAEKVWWGDFCKLSRELIDASGVDPADIGCVGLSALGCDCVPVDEEGRARRRGVRQLGGARLARGRGGAHRSGPERP